MRGRCGRERKRKKDIDRQADRQIVCWLVT